jgi:hypothetical protein
LADGCQQVQFQSGKPQNHYNSSQIRKNLLTTEKSPENGKIRRKAAGKNYVNVILSQVFHASVTHCY